MPGAIGTAFVNIALDPRQVGNELNKLSGAATGRLGAFGKKGGLLLGAGIAAGVGAAVGAGKLLYDVGASFDDMSDTIRTSTGKSGAALAELERSAKNVATTVPASFADAGEAVSVLSTRLGVTGKPLEAVSAQVLELARMTGQDLPSALNATTRMLGDAGLKGAAAGKGIDEVFRASQATATPVDRLMTLMTKFGGPMRQLGFDFTEQAALLGKFESEGVNTELVMGSMRQALGRMAKAGKDAPKAFRETLEAIKATKNPADATRKAIELFGARAGPDMAAAIREGRFGIDELVGQIKNGKDTVLGAADDTKDFSEQWQIFKNRVAVAVAPVATKLFDAIGNGMAIVAEKAPAVIAALEQHLGPAFAAMGEAATQFGPILAQAFDIVTQAAVAAGPAITEIGGALAVMGAAIGPAFAELAAAVQSSMPAIKQTLGDIAIIVRQLGPVWQWLGRIIAANVRAIAGVIKPLVGIIAGVVHLIAALLQGDWSAAWDAALSIVRNVGALLQAIVNGWLGMMRALLSPFAGAAKAIGNAIKSGITGVLGGIAGAVSGAFNAVRGALSAALSWAGSTAGAIGDAIAEGVMGAVRGLASAVSGVLTRVSSALGRAKGLAQGALRGAGTWLVQAGRQIISGLVSGISAAWGLVSGKLGALAGQVTGALAGAGTWLVQAGRDLIQGFINGMGSMLSGVLNKARELAEAAINKIKSVAHIGSPSRVMIDVGKDFSLGLQIGITQGLQGVVDAAGKVATAMIDAAKSRVSTAADELGTVLTKAFEVAGKQARAKSAAELELAALEASHGAGTGERALTAAEQALAARAAARERESHEAAVAEAQAEVAAARTAKAKLEAQAKLDAALYDQQTYALELQAEQERQAQAAQATTDAANAATAYETRKAQLEAQIALEQQHAEAEEWLRQQAFQKSLANYQTYLNSRNATQAGANQRLQKLMQTFGLTFEQIGVAMGKSFQKTAQDAATEAGNAIANMTKKLAAALDQLRRKIGAAKGKQIITTRGAKAGAAGNDDWLVEPPSPSVTAPVGVGDVTAGGILVSVQIGDQELRDIVAYEVSRGNTALAQALVAGGAR